ncbi:MAG: myo-inosose-2 dehydratase [Hyphomicrobiales bacterium]|nr:myo-inosose-2 dehydratase [Hyphomicrobiales bacterium]MDE2016475.1 myo-inosose-2 dehydratase [Hyphomicrobiales bacterium]
MTIRIGANPIAWSNDDLHDIGGHISLETCLSQAREIGFEGMELGHKFPTEPAELKAKLAEYDMAFVGGWYSTHLLRRTAAEEFAASAKHRAMCAGAGTDVFIVAECSNTIHGDRGKPLSARPKLDKAGWKTFGERMTEFGARLADAGHRLAYHHHMGTVVQTPEDIDAFMAATEAPANLLLDTGHVTWGGGDPAKVARAYRERIVHVHCKDVRAHKAAEAARLDLSFLDAIVGRGAELGVYTTPGDGMVDYEATFKALPGYSGWVVVEAEQDPLKADPLAYGRRGMAHLKRALAAAGLRKN